jgi:hypothetical protein
VNASSLKKFPTTERLTAERGISSGRWENPHFYSKVKYVTWTKPSEYLATYEPKSENLIREALMPVQSVESDCPCDRSAFQSEKPEGSKTLRDVLGVNQCRKIW